MYEFTPVNLLGHTEPYMQKLTDRTTKNCVVLKCFIDNRNMIDVLGIYLSNVIVSNSYLYIFAWFHRLCLASVKIIESVCPRTVTVSADTAASYNRTIQHYYSGV